MKDLGVVRSTALPEASPAMLRAQLDRFYVRVLGFMYQVLGDAELAAQATERVFLKLGAANDEVALWSGAMTVLREYLARGFVVRPLGPLATDWQAELLKGLAQLAPLERALLLLRYHEEVSPADLACVLGVDEPTVRAQIARARDHLLDLL